MDEPPSTLPAVLLRLHLPLLTAPANWWGNVALTALAVVLLLVLVALLAAAEVAFFSIKTNEITDLREQGETFADRLLLLLDRPKHLLATLLIAINAANIGVVLTSTHLLDLLLGERNAGAEGYWIRFAVNISVEAFLIVLFGEVMPKLYAQSYKWQVAAFMATPVQALQWLFAPFSWVLVASSHVLERNIKTTSNPISEEELSHAIDLAMPQNDTPQGSFGQKWHMKDEQDLLRSILQFGNVSVRQVMRARVDVVTVDIDDDLEAVLKTVRDSGYSRLPITDDSSDNIVGILFAKDLLPLLGTNEQWQAKKHPALFVPETKKLDDLLRLFQEKRMHMAVVVDEYGGTLGIVTLEDILEEVVGEIHDEFDEPSEDFYQKIDDTTYLFEAKTMLNDFCRTLHIDLASVKRGEYDSLAGLLLHITHRIPRKGEVIPFDDRFNFEVEEVDARRIIKVKVKLLR